eukprot:212665_1
MLPYAQLGHSRRIIWSDEWNNRLNSARPTSNLAYTGSGTVALGAFGRTKASVHLGSVGDAVVSVGDAVVSVGDAVVSVGVWVGASVAVLRIQYLHSLSASTPTSAEHQL